MKIIITENQLKDKIHHLIKTEGWKDTCEMLGLGGKELAQKFFNNNPMEFLNLYNDLDVVQTKKNPNWTLFRFNSEYNLMVYDRKNKFMYFDRIYIYNVLHFGFELDMNEIQEIIVNWVSEVFDLKLLKSIKFGLKG